MTPADRMAAVPPDITVIVPLLDEEANVAPLHHELSRAMEAFGAPYEVLLIDDGSTDGTFARLSEVQAGDPRVRVIRFTRNFGQTAAFAAGFAHARGRVVVTLDGDLQNDPADIPRLLDLARDHDIVCGWRKKRQDAFLTRHVPSVAANWLIGRVTGIRLHDIGCSLKAYRVDVVKPLRLSPGMHRYLPVFASRLGGRITEVAVNHRPRRSGRSKYGLSRTFGVVRDLVRLPRLMREAVDSSAPRKPLYEVQQTLDTVSERS